MLPKSYSSIKTKCKAPNAKTKFILLFPLKEKKKQCLMNSSQSKKNNVMSCNVIEMRLGSASIKLK